MKYYVRDTKGRVAGPFSVEDIKQAAYEGRILPSWELSSTQEKWTLAAKVPDLFPSAAIATPVVPAAGSHTDSTHEGSLALFLDIFKGGETWFKDAWPLVQKSRLWWIKLTRPWNGFIVTEVGPKGISRARYDFANKRPASVSEEEYEKELQSAMGRLDWYVAFALVVIVAGGIWALADFGESPNPTSGVLKLAAILVILIAGHIYKAKRSEVFIGYVLAPEIDAKFKELRDAFGSLSRCSRVWALRVRATDLQWKYTVTGQMGHLPAAKFGRGLPNIRTNVVVCGVSFDRFAIYFLPERFVVVDGGHVRLVAYGQLEIGHDHVDYLHTGWQRYSDSMVVGHRWLHSRVNGQPDRRYKVNYQIPILRLGVLALGVPSSSMGLITTDPNAPEVFRRNLARLEIAG